MAIKIMTDDSKVLLHSVQRLNLFGMILLNSILNCSRFSWQ